MAEFGTSRMSDELAERAEAYPHLGEYLDAFYDEHAEYPAYIDEPSSEYESDRPDVIYPAADDGPIFCHVFGDRGVETTYYAVEPTLREDERSLLEDVRGEILTRSANQPAPTDKAAFEAHLESLCSTVVDVDDGTSGSSIGDRIRALAGHGQFVVSPETFDRLQYHLRRDIVGLGALEPVMQDNANEDIHIIGPHQCYVVHGTYGMLPTNVDFGSSAAFENWLRNMGERMDNPVSDADPIVDATLPNGSRINIIYSDDVSIQGPSLTIRQGEDVPLSILQITKWGTLSPALSAYLWLCMENERTVFVVGETASGKTTTLNCMFSFIPRDAKIYTAEDTAEVVPPHDTWQQLLTREGLGDASGEVDMFDLVAAALRSRPDYIVVGEVRGEEGRMAFQAAQTGHPILLTFHASDIVSMIQRFTGDPINVPETFMDNADVAIFQNRVKRGDEVLRRVTSVQEIEGYSEEMDGVVTREVFTWDPVNDEIVFQGHNNSHVLEDKIANLLGYADTRDIYDDLDHRTRVMERLIDEGVLEYDQVNGAIAAFQRDGVEGLPIDLYERA